MHFTLLSKWVFKLSDPDPYPSVPHGHYQNKPWPKLDPYTGRVFKGKSQEDYKISKKELEKIWKNNQFKEFCNEQVKHYMETHAYKFTKEKQSLMKQRGIKFTLK